MRGAALGPGRRAGGGCLRRYTAAILSEAGERSGAAVREGGTAATQLAGLIS